MEYADVWAVVLQKAYSYNKCSGFLSTRTLCIFMLLFNYKSEWHHTAKLNGKGTFNHCQSDRHSMYTAAAQEQTTSAFGFDLVADIRLVQLLWPLSHRWPNDSDLPYRIEYVALQDKRVRYIYIFSNTISGVTNHIPIKLDISQHTLLVSFYSPIILWWIVLWSTKFIPRVIGQLLCIWFQ